MPAPDLPDWAQAVSELEKVDALPVAGGGVVANGAQQSFDVSRYASLTVATGAAPGAVGVKYLLFLLWSVGAVGVAQEAVSFHSDASYPNAGTSPVWQGPVRAPTLSVGAFGDGNNLIPVAVFGSSRTLPSPQLSNTRTGNGRLLNRINGVPIAAAATKTLYIPPVAAAVAIGWEPGVSTAIRAQLNGVAAPGGAMSATQLWVTTSVANGLYTDPIPLAHAGSELLITNNDTVSRSPTINVWDVS